MQQVQQSTSDRIAWIDSAKGIAIALVVFAHVLGGSTARGWFGNGHEARVVYDYIYLFHMPVFFLISGALAIESMRARPWATLVSRMRGIAWPYLLWGLISIAILPLIDRFMLVAPTDDLSTSLWKLLTGQASWFLWTLFVIEVLILPIARAPLALLLSGSLLIFAISAKYAPFGLWTTVVRNAPFFLMGCIASHRLRKLQPAFTMGQSVVFIVVGILLFAMLALMMSMSVDQSELLYLFGGVVGSTATVACTLAIRGAWLKRILQSLGLASLAIFLLHPYFQGATRELLVRFAKLDPRYAFPFIILGALVGPWLTWQIASRLGLGWLFRLPPRRKVSLA